MNKPTLTIIFFVAALYSSFGQQQNYPKGVYMNFNEIVNKMPSQQLDLDVIKRTKSNIKMVGGNDYKLISKDKSVKNKFIKQKIWAYSLGDTLFLNCFQYKVQPWYSCIISDGDYLVFRGGLSQNSKEQKKQMQMGFYFGAIGGAIAGAKLALLRFLYVIDKNTNEISTVSPGSLREILEGNDKLLDQYNNETDKESESTLLKYIKLVNEE